MKQPPNPVTKAFQKSGERYRDDQDHGQRDKEDIDFDQRVTKIVNRQIAAAFRKAGIDLGKRGPNDIRKP